MDNSIINPFVILIDQREQWPYSFHGFRANADKGRKPLLVPCERVHLKTGDYSINGYREQVTIERKTLADLYSTLSQGRERFEAEHARMSEMESAAVVIEADYRTALFEPPGMSRLNPKSVHRTMLSWWHRYKVPWFFAGGRQAAQTFTFRFLEKFWESKQ